MKQLLTIIQIIAALYFLFSPQPVYGQGNDDLLVESPDISAFPVVSVRVKPQTISAFGSEAWSADQVTVIENGQKRSLVSLEQHITGINFSVAINGSRELDLRDAAGVSPYQKLAGTLSDWAQDRRSKNQDAWSIFTDEGSIILNSSDPITWANHLDSYQPDFRLMQSTLTSLEQAIRNAQDRVVPFGVDHVVLFITTAPFSEQIVEINNLAEAAHSAGVRVNVWMVDDPFYLTHARGLSLVNLVERTGGRFFHYFEGAELPNPEAYVENQGVFYTLKYESGIRESGTFPLAVNVELADGEVYGQSQPFYLDLQPPKPILIDPPASLVRLENADLNDKLVAEPSSDKYTVEIMIVFPDGQVREIVASRLFINGELENEQRNAPFETLTWNIGLIEESGIYTIQVLVEDELGLSDQTIITPVEVTIQQPAPLTELSVVQTGWTIILIIFAAALILFLVWLIYRFWQGNGGNLVRSYLARVKTKPPEISVIDPVLDQKIQASLLPLGLYDPLVADGVVQITRKKVKLGNDPRKADLVIDQPGLSGLQVSIQINHGQFWISDLGSENGTWLNGTLVGTKPVKVKPGDLIHFGATGYRFTTIDPTSPPEPAVSTYESIL